jgi:tetratricopeptide (TPR) repeat protein
MNTIKLLQNPGFCESGPDCSGKSGFLAVFPEVPAIGKANFVCPVPFGLRVKPGFQPVLPGACSSNRRFTPAGFWNRLKASLFFALIVPLILAGISACAAGPKPAGEIPAEGAPEKPPEPRDTRDLLTLIAERLAGRDFDGAIALFDKIDPAEAGTNRIRLLKASVLSSAGKTADARAITDSILAAEPENTDALMVLSAIYGSSGNEKEEKAVLERIIKLDPRRADALTALGNIAFKAQSLRSAGAYYDRALETEPQNGEALVGRGLVYRYSRDPKNAEKYFNQAVRLFPQWASPRHERARLYRGAGYAKQALEDLDMAKKLEPANYWITVDRGNVLLELKRRQEALEEFSLAIKLDPENFFAYVYSAGIKDDLGDYEGAEKDYLVITKLKSDYYFAYEGLGIIKMRKHQYAEARDYFLEAYRQSPKTASYAILASMNWMRAGKIGDPRQFLEQAIRGSERESLEWYMLRLYHDLSGDNDIAIRLDKEKDPDKKFRMLYYLAGYYAIRGNNSLADRYFLQAKDLDRKGVFEWRLNELALTERNLKVF